MDLDNIKEIINSTAERKDISSVISGYDKVFGAFYYSPAEYFWNETEKILMNSKGACLIQDTTDFLTDCTDLFIKEIIPCVISTLIVEIYERKEKNIYPSDDIYEDFYNDLKDKNTMTGLAVKYPCLFSLMYEVGKRRAEYISSCLENIYDNLETIRKTLDIDFGYITSLKITNGDSHNGGKKVILVETDGGRFVYKPHSLAPEILFEKILGLINDTDILEYDLKCPAAVSFSDFGIQEYIFRKDIDSEQEAVRYYYRIGAFSALFDCLTSEDFHHENIICSGEYPFFVDLETLISNTQSERDIFKGNDLLKKVANEFNDSVLGSMIFPLNTSSSLFDMDISGLTGSSYGKSQKWRSYDLINVGTDKIRFVSKEGHGSDADNLLMYKEKQVNPVYFIDEILKGYTDSVKAIKKISDVILEEIRTGNIKIRRVLRPTAFYGKILQASYAPKFTASEELRLKMFSKLYANFKNDEKEQPRIVSEITALMRNDIPLFEQEVCSRGLIADGRTIIENYNSSSPYENIVRKFEHFDTAYVKKQIKYIRMSISSNHRNDDDRENFGRHIPNEKLKLGHDLLSAAEKIAEHICETTICSDDGRYIAWYTETLGDRYMLEICDTKIYDGGGNILFFLSLWKCTQDPKWLDTAQKAFEGMEKLGVMENINDISFFVGSVGTIYILYWFYSFTGEKTYLEKLENFADKMFAKLSEIHTDTDLLSGMSGAVTALVRINRNINIKTIDDILDVIANKLYNTAEKDELICMTGFAHGFAGISLALAVYGDYIGDKKFIFLAEKLVEKENTYISEKAENWYDLRKDNAFGVYWCHGAPGIALSRLMIKDIISTDVDRDIEWGLKCLTSQGLSDDLDHSLCHGVFGSIDMLITFGKRVGNNKLIKIAEDAAFKYIADIEENGFRPGFASMPAVPSFMTGITGVGYELLRVYDNSLPSVNAIEVMESRGK